MKFVDKITVNLKLIYSKYSIRKLFEQQKLGICPTAPVASVITINRVQDVYLCLYIFQLCAISPNPVKSTTKKVGRYFDQFF